ncbi:hypothetical protein OXX80_009942 [Metschnikowia pulcherrima]
MSADSEAENTLAATQGSAPMVERDVLIKKLESVPEDVLRSILTNQVDLEIRLKHRELKLTEEEIGKCEAQMLALRKFFEVPNELSFRNEPNDFTLKYFDILNKSLSVNYTKLQQLQYAKENPVFKETMFVGNEPTTHSYRTRSTTSSLRPSVGGPTVRIAGCLYRRTDGVIVRLTCPDCHRSNFSSAQGFLNHNRIAHSKEFSSQDSAALHCGEVLPDEYQDEEGIASLSSIKSRGLDPSKNLNSKDGYFDGVAVPNKAGQSSTTTESEGRNKFSSHRSSSNTPKAMGPRSEDLKGLESKSIDDGFGAQELMKKLISKGVARDEEDFQQIIEKYREGTLNSHLFADEEEEEEEEAKENFDKTSEKVVPEIGSKEASEDQQPGAVKTNLNELKRDLQAKATEGEEEDTAPSARAQTGGKYGNRLRRRKSRADMSLTGTRVESAGEEGGKEIDERRFKRRKSQR